MGQLGQKAGGQARPQQAPGQGCLRHQAVVQQKVQKLHTSQVKTAPSALVKVFCACQDKLLSGCLGISNSAGSDLRHYRS